jgi:hypothetical protein
MKYILIAVMALTITGCAMKKPVLMMPEFPAAVKELTEKCPELKLIETDQVAITDMLKVIVENYSRYHQCSYKVEGWNDWYTEQKKIYDDLRSKGKQ